MTTGVFISSCALLSVPHSLILLTTCVFLTLQYGFNFNNLSVPSLTLLNGFNINKLSVPNLPLLNGLTE